MILSTAATSIQLRDHGGPALEVDVDSAGVGFRGELQAQLATDLFHPWLDLLDVVD